MLLSTILILIGLTQVYGRSSGPPASTCSSMTPNHGSSSAQLSASPYTVTFSKSTYSANEQIQVTLQGSPDFKGFFIQPRKSSSDATTYGSITIPTNYQNPCSGGTAALSHSSSSVTLKSNVTFNWTAPATDEGPILFVFTVVQDKPTFWVKETSSTITYQATTGPTQTVTQGPTTTQSPTTTQAPTTSTIKKNSGCGSEVGCFHDCEGDADCNFQLTFKDNGGDNVAFTVACFGTGDRYCAFGLSADSLMGDDSVFAIVSSGGTVEARHFYNDGKSNAPLDNPTFGLTVLSASHVDGVISCTFTRKKTAAQVGSSSGRKKRAVSDASTFFSLDDDWTLFYADGTYSSGFLTKHVKAPKVSCKKVDFQSFVDLSICSPTLVFLHATFMAIAWMLFATIGLFTARYYKTVWPEGTELFGQKRWFTIHRLTMVVVVLCNIVGFIVIFLYAEGYSKIAGSWFKKSHPVIGIIVMVFTVINPIMALFRPKPDTKFRPVFNITHMCVGYGAYCLAILNIMSGTLLATTNVPPYIRTVLYIFEGWLLLLHVWLTIYDYCNSKDNARRVDDSKPRSPGVDDSKPRSPGVDDSKPRSPENGTSNHYEMDTRERTSGTQETKKDGLHWKTVLLVVNVMVLLGFTLAVVIIVWTKRDN